jgi:hypothetical protein
MTISEQQKTRDNMTWEYWLTENKNVSTCEVNAGRELEIWKAGYATLCICITLVLLMVHCTVNSFKSIVIVVIGV